MSNLAHSPLAPLQRIFAWRRLKVVLITCLVFNLLLSLTWKAPMWMLTARLLLMGLSLLMVFGLLEAWPRKLPRWMARWALQVLGVAIAIPIVTFFAYSLTLIGSPGPWWSDTERVSGWFSLSMMGLLVVPWICVSALFKQITNAAEKQSLAFALEKSELERRASEARLTLLQTQMEPHFLFNTLANIRELVLAGSPQAPQVLDSLIAYLRAAVPRLRDSRATLAQELDLVRAYLEIMRMRMPDRLRFHIDAQPAALQLPCPPMSVLTLVENAVRHGVDPQEEGGSIHVEAMLTQVGLRVTVRDDGRGLRGPGGPSAKAASADAASASLGTGLQRLLERLRLSHGDKASLHLRDNPPHGTIAVMDLPSDAAQLMSPPSPVAATASSNPA